LAFLIFNVQSVVVSVVCSRKKDTLHLRKGSCTASAKKRGLEGRESNKEGGMSQANLQSQMPVNCN